MEPEILQSIFKRLDTIEALVRCSGKNVLNREEVCQQYGISRSLLEKLASKNKIPHYKNAEGGRLNYFDRQEVEDFLKGIRIDTNDELQSYAEAFNYKNRNHA